MVTVAKLALDREPTGPLLLDDSLPDVGSRSQSVSPKRSALSLRSGSSVLAQISAHICGASDSRGVGGP